MATSPRLLVHINWDAGSYIHQIASGSVRWSNAPWNAHYGMQHMYLIFFWVARLAGGTYIDGARLLDALCLAIIAALLADAGMRIAGSRVVAGLAAAFWASAFVTQFLIFTLEDNLVFLTPAAGILWLCAVRAEKWGAGESLLAGLLAAAAGLTSIQGVVYVLPPLYVGFVLAAAKPRRARARNAGLTLLALLVGAMGFALFLSATSAPSDAAALSFLFSRPEPSQFPKSTDEAIKLLSDVTGSLKTLGIATSLQLFSNRIVFASRLWLASIGGFVLLVEMTISSPPPGGPTADAAGDRTSSQPAARLHGADRPIPGRRLRLPETYRFRAVLRGLPLHHFAPGVFFVAVAARIALVALAVLVAAQAFAAWRWRRAEARSYATLDETIIGRRLPGYHGIPGEGSFFRHFRALRQANPSACAFVFDASEVAHGRWNPDLTANIWSELPAHYIVGIQP